MPQLPRLDRRTVLPTAGPTVRVQQTGTPSPGGVVAEGLSVATNELAQVEVQRQRRADEEGISAAGLALADFRTRAWQRLESLEREAPLGAPNLSQTFLGELQKDSSRLVQEAPTRRTRAYLKAALANEGTILARAASEAESRARTAKINVEQTAIVDHAQVLLQQQPDRFDTQVLEVEKYLENTGLAAGEREARRISGRAKLAGAAVLGLIETNPEEVLAALSAAPGESGRSAIEALSAAQREHLRGIAETRLEEHRADEILAIYRQDFRAGSQAVQALASSGLDPARLDGIRRKVRAGVELLRDERLAANVDSLAAVERDIAAGADIDKTVVTLEALYREGVLTPGQLSGLQERAFTTAARVAGAQAVTQEVAAALAEGLPLDPSNSSHREALNVAFITEVGSQVAGSAHWQSVALTYAGRTRLLPPPVTSWLRSAARSPDAKLAVTAAQFYGSLEQTSPEAAGDVDSDTRAFLASLGAMVTAGAEPRTAFETARANVYETRKDILEQRRTTYQAAAKSTDGALTGFIDRDFDTLFSAEPAASASLRGDFDRQARAYFEKTGDLELARDLAWKDLKRVYGPSRINGAPVVMPFPVERFGVTPEEVRKDIATFLRKSGQELDPEAVLVVPDGLTLRHVTDVLSGQPVLPSYRLVLPNGDLVTDPQGVPVRYTLPNADELGRRIEAARRQAEEAAAANVARARQRRDATEAARRANPAGAPFPTYGGP